MKLDSQSYFLNHLILRVPTRPREFIYLTLQASDYHLSIIDDLTLKRGSVTITERGVSVAFSKEVDEVESQGRMGIDVNEKNVTWSDSMGNTEREDISEIPELKARYRVLRGKVAERTHTDRRVRRRLLSKYGKREKDRCIQIINPLSKRIVEHARRNGFKILMENLKGIRKLYRKGNGQGRDYRWRMNSWMFHEFQRQVDYKAAWLGVPVAYVNPRFTSRKCPECGSQLIRLEGRNVCCPSCELKGDRDEIASRNIMACEVPQARPGS